ncbi:hypothetical protein ACVDG3_17465 [Meridianimarinicoccus sp. RP-17]|uniref:hypothetical protein n=1 Tax=Meridianimarinicoccus zhengii TaxID=2056810 RepID=UPI0013A6D18E|nr:hypothetical protein [Phycocomes zhengii]
MSLAALVFGQASAQGTPSAANGVVVNPEGDLLMPGSVLSDLEPPPPPRRTEVGPIFPNFKFPGR